MKTTTFLFVLLLLTSCQGTATDEAAGQNDTAATDSLNAGQTGQPEQAEKAEPQKQTGKLPSIEIYAGRSYDDKLQHELNERNTHHQERTEIMTLLDASSGEDVSIIIFKDDEGREQSFSSWPYETDLQFDMHDDGDNLADSEKGKKYKVTYSLRAYWSDSGGEVVEDMVVKKIVRVK